MVDAENLPHLDLQDFVMVRQPPSGGRDGRGWRERRPGSRHRGRRDRDRCWYRRRSGGGRRGAGPERPATWPGIVALSRASYRKMVQNLWWAAGYNIVAIPLAADVLASRGIVLSPGIAAIRMSLSTVIVAINAQLLRRERL